MRLQVSFLTKLQYWKPPKGQSETCFRMNHMYDKYNSNVYLDLWKFDIFCWIQICAQWNAIIISSDGMNVPLLWQLWKSMTQYGIKYTQHDDIIKWKHFPRYWPFVRGIHRSPVNSPHKGQWRGNLMFPLICTWTNGWLNNREAGDLRRHHAHYDVTVMGPILGHHCVCRWSGT